MISSPGGLHNECTMLCLFSAGCIQIVPIALQVVGRAEPHSLSLLHPSQDRVVTVRENARMQV